MLRKSIKSGVIKEITKVKVKSNSQWSTVIFYYGICSRFFGCCIKNGKVSGSAIAYGTYTDYKAADKSDFAGGYGTINLGYETSSYNGFTAKAAFEAGHAVADAELVNDALMTKLILNNTNDMVSVTVGRQVVNDLEWLNHYNEAVMSSITAVPDTKIVLGYVNQHATADENEIGNFYDTGLKKVYMQPMLNILD